jgi:DHA2 family multidrug resistance protein
VPVGLFCGYICWTNLKNQETPTRKLPIDRMGLVLLFIWVGSLQILLDKGKDLDWFQSTPIVVLAVVTAISFVAWLIWELTEAQPVVDLSLFRSRSFALGCVALCLGYAVFFGNIVLMPLWLQTNLDYTATWAGLISAPSGVVAVVLSPLVSRLMRRYDSRLFASASFIFFAISYYMRAQFTADASFIAFMLPQLVVGIAMSMFFVSMLSITFDGLPPDKVPSASGLSNFLRITAGSFATSLTTTFWDRREALHQSRLAEAVTRFTPAYQDAMGRMQALGLTDTAASGALTRTLVDQGYLLSSLDLFYLSAWLAVAIVPLCWLVRRPSGAPAAVAAD